MAEPEILSKHQEQATTDAIDANDTHPSLEEEKYSPDSPTSSKEGQDPDSEAFVNNGLIKWQNARDKWCQKPKGDSPKEERHAIPIDVDGIIDVLFDPRWRGGGGRVQVSKVPPRFPKNVPLPQMIDVLTDLWEAEGLDV